MNPYDEKPPIGVMPEWIWKQERARELARAIERFVNSGLYHHAGTIAEWCDELAKLLREISENK